MPSAEDILGPRPASNESFQNVSDILGPRPGSPEATSFIAGESPEDNLARASRDFQSLRGTQFDPTQTPPTAEVLRPQTLTERLRNSPAIVSILGPPAPQNVPGTIRGDQVEGILPTVMSTPLPFVLQPEMALEQFPAVAGATSKAMQAYFTYQFAAEQPEILPRLKHAVQVGDWKTARDLAGNEVLNGAFIAAGVHGATTGETEGPVFTSKGEELGQRLEDVITETPPVGATQEEAAGIEAGAIIGGEPTVFDVLGPPPAGTILSGQFSEAFERLERQRAADLKAARQAEDAARKAARPSKPEVPGTPPEPLAGTTAEQEALLTRQLQLDQIRAAGKGKAGTTKQIKALFADQNLNNQQAAALRREAWVETKPPETATETPPATTTPAETETERAKRETIAGRIKAGIKPEDLQLTVSYDPSFPQIPGYVQVDEISRAAGNVFSSNPAQMKSLGFEMPSQDELLKLQPGRYTLPQAQEALARLNAPKPATPAPAAGGKFSASTPLGDHRVSGQYDLLESDQIVSGNDPGYDPRMQPRDRSREASKAQVLAIMQRFDPQRLGESLTSDTGAPLVNEQNHVLSGNGRTAAIRGLYGTGRSKAYKDWLLHNARDFGLDPAQVQRMARPILVRRVTDFGGLDPLEFARLSNQQQVMGMGPAEKAVADARMLESNPQLLELFRPGEDGDVLAASNREFLNNFVQGTGDQAELLTKEGYNRPVLEKRVQNALLTAFLGDEQRGLTSALIEEAEKYNLKTARTAVLGAAPTLLKYRGTPYDIRGYLGQALKDLVSFRRSGQKLGDYLGSQDMFSDRSPYSDMILDDLATERSAGKLMNTLIEYARDADEGLRALQTPDIFGVPAVTREQIIERIYGRPTEQRPTQADLPTGGAAPKPVAGGEPPGPGDAGLLPSPETGGPGPAAAPDRARILTKAKADAARARMLERQKRLTAGIDPTMLADAVIIAGNKIENGFLKYRDFVNEMLRDLGPEFRPYFKLAYNQVRDYTELHHLKNQLSPRDEVEAYEDQATRQQGELGIPTAEGTGSRPELPGTVRGAGPGRRPGIRVVDEGDLPPARPIVGPQQYQGPEGLSIDETQRLAVNQALTLFEDGGSAFLLGDGTGVGKTGTELVMAAEVAKRTKLPSLIVTQNLGIIENRFKADAQRFGVPTRDIEFLTYADLSRGKAPAKKYGAVIFDEAHNLKNAGSARQFNAQLLDAQHKVFATATPMDSPTHAAYFLSQLTGHTPDEVAHMLGYSFVTREIRGQERTFVQLLKGFSWHNVIENIKALRQRSVQKGSLIRREYPFFGEANFRNTSSLDEINVRDQNQIADYWDKQIKRARSPNYRRNLAGQRILELSRWLESTKVAEVLPAIESDIAAGKRVVVFAEGYSPTLIKGLGREVPGFLSKLAASLDQKGIKYLKLFEDSPAKKSKAAAAFQKGEASVILATPQSGGAGIDLDDIVGNAPRAAHFVTMNFSGDLFDQMLGRVSRRNTASPAEVHIWRTPDGLADRRRQQVLDNKLQVLRNIQTGQDLDVNRFVEQARGEEAAPGAAGTSGPPQGVDQPQGAGQTAFRETPSIAASAESRTVQGREQPGALQGRLSGAARTQAQNARALRTQQQGGPTGLQRAAQRLAAVRAAQHQALFLNLRRYFAPATIDEDARAMSVILRAALGREYEFLRQADFALRPFRDDFDRTPVGRNWTYDPAAPLPRNYEVMRAIDTGQVANLTPAETDFAREMRTQLDQAIAMVQQVSPNSLRELVENYFPRIWRDPEANRDKLNILLSRRPWEGPKGFLKQRVLDYFTDGLELGLRPISDNPVDVTIQKLGEMARFAVGRKALEEARAYGLRKFVYVYEQKPAGWQVVDDPSSRVFAPPTVTIKEAFDETVRVKTLELLQALGVPHERLARIGGRGRWGYASQSGKIVTKFGGPDFVIWHEFGHQMDWRFPELGRRLGALSPNSGLGRELAALADLRYAGKAVPQGFKDYVRQREEKIANVFDAYLRAPELFQQTAPRVWSEFLTWLNEHPEVKNPLNEITKPRGLVLGSASTEQFVGGPIKLGDWYMPAGAAQVFNNHLQPGLGRFAAFRGLREIAGMVNGMQLLGFFHGQFVFNDILYSGIGLPLYDVLNGRPGRALKELARVPLAPVLTILEGHKVKSAIENPAAASGQYRDIARLATEANLRAGHTGYDAEYYRRWRRAWSEFRVEPSVGALWEGFWRTPFAAVDRVMLPVMEYFVPRAKYGVFARMAARVIEDNPTADKIQLRKKLAEAADSTEDRLGQVTYDNLFQARLVKDAGQLIFRSYGWQFTKYRMIGGGAADWVKAGTALARGAKPNVTFRMTYLPAMVAGHALIGGLVMYLLSGRRPQKLIDYLFPETGEVDAYGNPVRVSIADFVKDVVADFRSFPNIKRMGEEWTRKLAPFWNMAGEIYRDEDYWGNRIFTPREAGEDWETHLLKNLREGAQYMAGQGQPFSMSAADKFMQAGVNPVVARLAPFLGYVPAPRYATQTPAEARAAELMRGSLPRSGLSKEEGEKSRAVAQIIRDLRTGKINNEGEFVNRARAAGVKNQQELTRIQERTLWSPLQYQVAKMQDLDRAMEVFDLANHEERVSLAPILAERIQRAWDGGRLPQEKASRYVTLVQPFYSEALAPPQQPRTNGAPAARDRFSAFTPER